MIQQLKEIKKKAKKVRQKIERYREIKESNNLLRILENEKS